MVERNHKQGITLHRFGETASKTIGVEGGLDDVLQSSLRSKGFLDNLLFDFFDVLDVFNNFFSRHDLRGS